ncbi:MAG: aminoglycoside phosphotransferase family protein [Dehalococcoidia bacterium]
MDFPEIHPILARRLSDTYGDFGRQWLASLPALLHRFREAWSISEVGETFGYVGYSWVAPCQLADGTRAVIKLAPPDKEFANEIEALKLYAGDGAVRLLASDSSAMALLLERLEPGTMLVEMEDDVAATEIAALTFKRLFRPLPGGHTFPTIARWGQAFERVRARYDGGSGSFPSELFELAAAIYAEMCADQETPVLLHGDLHHQNILRSGDDWVAIDPKGLAGEPAYEIGPLLYNKKDAGPDLRALSLRRIAQVSEILELDRQRVLRWGFAESVLSVLWNFEDSGTVEEADLVVPRALIGEV